MRNIVLATFALFFHGLVAGAAPGLAAEAPQRHAGAHVHGQGTLNVALDGNALAIELEAPGADIAGFEHAATSDADKAALDAAKAKLSAALSLFKLPGEASCKLDSADVKVEAEDHDDDEDAAAHDKNVHEEHGGHSAFHAAYALTCAKPDKLAKIETSYFAQFPNAQTLNANVVTAAGQTQAKLTREHAILDLAGAQ